MLISDTKQIGAVDKSEDRRTFADSIAAILGLIHGSSLIHIIHGHFTYTDACSTDCEAYDFEDDFF